MEGATGIDERFWFLAADEQNCVHLCFTDGKKLLLCGYEHEEEKTDCVLVMFFELVIQVLKCTHTEKRAFFL